MISISEFELLKWIKSTMGLQCSDVSDGCLYFNKEMLICICIKSVICLNLNLHI